jgi:soluble lytic murein transglycosylase-like protein
VEDKRRLIFEHIPAYLSKAALLLGFVAIALISATTAQAQETAVKNELKSSLSELSSFYQNEVQKLEKRHQDSKALYTDGLISRVQFESDEKALADARAKVEQLAKEIAVANQPATVGAENLIVSASSNPVWSTGNGRVDNLIRHYGKLHGVDPYLIYCLMSQESSFVASATSHKGAQGLMQLMPGTAARYGVTNPYDVEQNIKGGTRYLKDLLKMFNGRVDLALAGYNAGEGAVMKYGNKIPPYDETRNYVRLILKRYTKKTI